MSKHKSKTLMCPDCGRILIISSKNQERLACGECQVPMVEMEQDKKIPCKTVELMIEPVYCGLISEKGTKCNCKERKKLLGAKKDD
jgi:ribosomal protein S27AE